MRLIRPVLRCFREGESRNFNRLILISFRFARAISAGCARSALRRRAAAAIAARAGAENESGPDAARIE
jgi:hypothetical protein